MTETKSDDLPFADKPHLRTIAGRVQDIEDCLLDLTKSGPAADAPADETAQLGSPAAVLGSKLVHLGRLLGKDMDGWDGNSHFPEIILYVPSLRAYQ